MPVFMPRGTGGKPVELMGLTFPNRLGLAAGLDKNGIAVSAFDRAGFGFIEVGTVTRVRSRATRARVCSACPNMRPSSTAWASTI